MKYGPVSCDSSPLIYFNVEVSGKFPRQWQREVKVALDHHYQHLRLRLTVSTEKPQADCVEGNGISGWKLIST